ncbi:acyloxyacyl hydrolase [Flavobacterium hercynium]|uniref:Acyloxyacyl hydrolase n=1 Tax=Flavobacterium hercynium TaxID=387094 RepID=A0A226HQ62_9FLAO|nr:acyloxyacyl hydrolase [Flavobacterium hercynium]OXA95781.1 hypothetical protein B0A66_02185 [Flavobacterium hercynium]SMP37187.1 Lipid A 3-O-deacylase (PagL) [Flavobacterium hercynium]
MYKKIWIIFLVVLCWSMTAQEKQNRFAVGLNYGFGSEFNNRNYTFENHFYKAQIQYLLKKTKHFQYEILVQPEVNFGKHQLLNFYFVKPDTPNFEEKRAEYTQLKEVHEYVLNLGFLFRKPINQVLSVYVLVSVGPMINDTETERISEGFAFADVAALGLSFKVQKLQLDVRPSIRHVSNAGLGSANAGYNTRNIEFGVLYSL